MNNELMILNQINPVIETNFDKVKENLQEKLSEYNKLVVTEDSLSFCKNEQKFLSKMKKEIDTYRKTIKTEMSAPIKEFESKCKELISIIEDTEKPLKDGINVYDDMKREEKKMFAIGEISKVVNELNLNDKYASMLQLKDRYMNLSISKKEVIEDITNEANNLLMQQQREIEVLETIKTTLERVNKDINTKLEMRDFLFFIKNDYSLTDIIKEIDKKADAIKKSEQEIKEKAIAQAKEEAIKEVEKAVIEQTKQEEQKEIKAINEAQEVMQITIELTGTVDKMRELQEFVIKSGLEYKVTKKEILN